MDNPRLRPYRPADRDACLALFDANTPEHFAPGERTVFERFLDKVPPDYVVLEGEGPVLAACGLSPDGEPGRLRINWFIVAPNMQGQGFGRLFMEHVRKDARRRGARVVDISASHVSEAFYAKFGAITLGRTEDGWGPGMHRVDMEWTV